jgi:uncharacterized protein (TIGR01627 family)
VNDWRPTRSNARSMVRRLCHPLGVTTVEACRIAGLRMPLRVVRRLLDIQLNLNELTMVEAALKTRSNNATFLVFGLGRDSKLWQAVNKSGLTVFLEDDRRWYEAVTTRHRSLRAHLVSYSTRRDEFALEAAWDAAKRRALELPDEVRRQRWDVVLVDGPAGDVGSAPGRLQSICAARQLAAFGGDVFIHDVDRDLERGCCDLFFADAELVGAVGRMRHYRVGT